MKDVYPWGTDWPPPPGAGNYLGQERPDKGVSGKASLEGYRDGFAYTAPVGRYRPNVLGLFDLGGNVWELTSDWTENVRGETRSVTRGAAFSYEDIGTLNSSQRSSINTEYLSHDALGFRVVLGPPLPDSTPADEKSSKHIDESGWNDFFEEWDRNPDRNNFERGSLKRFPEGWRPAGDGGANAYLVDPQGRDLAIRATAKFDPAPESKDNDQVTVRVRRRQGSALGKYNEYAGYLFRNGSAELQIVSDSGARIMKSADLTAGFEPHQFHTLELSTRGDQISFHVDGLEIASVKDGTHPAGGRFGINGSPSVVLFQSAAYRYLDGGKSPAQATKDEPFVNTLGMKFVPVPITGGPTDGKRVLFSVWETRVQDYEAFVKETKHEWEKPKFEQGPTHPTVMVSWEDAQAFCAWLTYKERKAGKLGADEVYRLPSDHEWSCAVGIGDKEDSAMLPSEKHTKLKTECLWGGEWPPPAETGNFSGEETIGREINKGQLS
ncbi:MAG: SUMF1/EgtB/PvdO family nonheme iron enzyme, partial [Verrucomicrobiales bacterium]